MLQLLKFLLVNGQKAQIDPERHGKTFLRVGDHFVSGSDWIYVCSIMSRWVVGLIQVCVVSRLGYP